MSKEESKVKMNGIKKEKGCPNRISQISDQPFLLLAMLKHIVDFGTMLIGAEGARLLENAIAFSSCGEYSWKLIQSPAGKAGQARPRRRRMRRGGFRTARGKRTPGAEINRQI